MTTTATKLKVIDCDSHFWQPLALWEKFIDAHYREPIVAAVDHVIGRGARRARAGGPGVKSFVGVSR